MGEETLKELDRVAFPVAGTERIPDDKVLDAMESVASANSDGLRQLVERYGHSLVPIVLRSLSFLLAQAGPAVTATTCNLVYDFIGKAGKSADLSTLMNVLTAIQRQAMCDLPWHPRESPPRAIDRCQNAVELARWQAFD